MSQTVNQLSLLNGVAVSIFGGVLSASFCGALSDRRRRWIFWLGLAVILAPQGAVYSLWSAEFRHQVYPLIVHLPLLLLLHTLTKRWLWPAISILSAYLFCQMRRWPALLAAALLPDGMAQMLVELAVTIPLLLLLLRFAAPAVRELMEHPVKTQCQFGFIPALYYGFDYLTKVYTDLLSRGTPAVVEFMPTVCCAAYLIFLLHNSAEERKRVLSRQVHENLTLQMSQAVREISGLRESQAQAVRYRHDMRHHMQYLLSCIENGQTERAQEYIAGICAQLETQQTRRFCENEAVNLILSAFARKAEGMNVRMEVRGALPGDAPVSDNDLCVILSNALENALHACLPFAEEGTECTISVEFSFLEQNGRLFLQIINPCRGEVRFEKGIPASDRPGHGIGVKSICAIVEQHRGSYQFLLEEGRFILRLFV